MSVSLHSSPVTVAAINEKGGGDVSNSKAHQPWWKIGKRTTIKTVPKVNEIVHEVGSSDEEERTTGTPPPPYKHSPLSTTSTLPPPSPTINQTSSSARRTRRLSKPQPIPNSTVDDMNAGLKRAGSAHTIISTTTSKIMFPRRNKTPQHTDSSGRPRPPVSGGRSSPTGSSGSSNSKNHASTTNGNGTETGGHSYFYKRSRACSNASPASRAAEALLCLQAVLDACEAGAVFDIRHIVEQVELARNILAGDEEGLTVGVGLTKPRFYGSGLGITASSSGPELGLSRPLSASPIGARGSVSVTSLATLGNIS